MASPAGGPSRLPLAPACRSWRSLMGQPRGRDTTHTLAPPTQRLDESQPISVAVVGAAAALI